MIKAEASIYFDRSRPKLNGQCSIKIKITYNRKRKYYSTGINLTPIDFDSVMYGKRKTPEQKEIFIKLQHYQNKAFQIINDLNIFTFGSFEDHFLTDRNTRDSVSFAFDNYIEQLRTEKRHETALSYESAKKSLQSFKNDLTFAEVSPKFLKRYEAWMLDHGKSISTIGIYLRSLRSIYNLQNIDKSIYPFGEGKNKYSIPTGKNIKKALTLDDIAKIYNFETVQGTTMDMAKDYWLFLYLCNGMNVKDFCLLKWENIDGNILTYKREKTKRSKKQNKVITVALKSETLDIIKKWGQPSINKDAFIFPHFTVQMDAERQLAVSRQLTKNINKYIKIIAKQLGIHDNVTTYFARHSFATVLKRSGAKIEMISELLGHSNVNVTESYLDSFENDQIQQQTDILTSGFRKAN